MTINVRYDATKGRAIADGDVEREYNQLAVAARATVCYSTDNIITRIRVGIAEGDLSPEDVTFLFEDHEMHTNKYGALEDQPRGFCDTTLDLLSRLVRSIAAQVRAERT